MLFEVCVLSTPIKQCRDGAMEEGEPILDVTLDYEGEQPSLILRPVTWGTCFLSWGPGKRQPARREATCWSSNVFCLAHILHGSQH